MQFVVPYVWSFHVVVASDESITLRLLVWHLAMCMYVFLFVCV